MTDRDDIEHRADTSWKARVECEEDLKDILEQRGSQQRCNIPFD